MQVIGSIEELVFSEEKAPGTYRTSSGMRSRTRRTLWAL